MLTFTINKIPEYFETITPLKLDASPAQSIALDLS